MRIFKLFLVCILGVVAVAAQGEIVAPVAVAPVQNSVKGMAAVTQVDGSPLPDINGKLSLDDCIAIALANSPSAVSAQLAKQSAQVELNLAKGNFLPTASADASNTYRVHKTDSFPTTEAHTGSAAASATLSLRGVTEIARNVKMKQVALEQANLKFEQVKNDIIRSVKKNYYALLTAIRAVDIRTKSRDVYKDQYERTLEYFKLGLRPKVDVTTAEVNLNNEQLRLIRATNAVKTVSAALANVLGITTPNILDIEEIADFDKWTISFEEAIRLAYENRPDVDSARLDVKLSEMKLNQAKAAYFPTFSFGAGFSKSGWISPSASKPEPVRSGIQ